MYDTSISHWKICSLSSSPTSNPTFFKVRSHTVSLSNTKGCAPTREEGLRSNQTLSATSLIWIQPSRIIRFTLDIDTLQLVSRVVSSICRPTDAREIDRNAFELLSSFDEIISLGYRENVNLAQVASISEMESHEEKIQEMIEKVRHLLLTEDWSILWMIQDLLTKHEVAPIRPFLTAFHTLHCTH